MLVYIYAMAQTISNRMVVLLNGLLELWAAYTVKKYGFLALVGTHFWTDIVWHIL